MKKYLILAAICLVAIISFKGSTINKDRGRRLEILLLGHQAKNHNAEKFAEIISQEWNSLI